MVALFTALMWLSILILVGLFIIMILKTVTGRRLLPQLTEDQERQLPIKVIIFNSVLMTVSYLGLSFLSGGLL